MGMLGYGYGLDIAIHRKYHTHFHGYTGFMGTMPNHMTLLINVNNYIEDKWQQQ